MLSAAEGVHPTYRHLEDRVRLGGLSLGQWAQLLACGVAAYLLSTLLPLPGSWSVSVAVTVCGLPAAGAITFMHEDFDVVGWLRAAVRWRRSPTHYAAHATVASAPGRQGAGPASAGRLAFDAESLWD